MAEVLVLAEHAGGQVKKVTCELVTAAARLGEPAVVWAGPGAAAGRERLAGYGAARIYVADGEEFAGYVVAPKAELLARLVADTSPAAVLIAGTTEGKEIAGRLAVKTNSGVLTDVIDVTAGDDGPLATHANFGGAITARATVTKGTPILAVRPNAITAQPAAAPGAAETVPVEFTASEAAKAARVTEHTAADKGARPELTEAPSWSPAAAAPAAPTVQDHRGPGRCAGRGGRRVPRGHRRGLVPAPVPGRPDRQDRLPAAVHGGRHLRRHPAPGRHADLQDHHRHQQGPRRAHLRDRRLGIVGDLFKVVPQLLEEIRAKND